MKPIKRRDFVKMSTLGSMGLILGCSGGRNFDLIIRNGLMLDGLGGLGSDGCAVAPYGKLALGKPHPRYYGTFPRVLGKYSRDEAILPLASAIKKMTSMPAKALGIKNRGSIEIGKQADLVVFDPGTVIDQATFADPHKYPLGIEHVIVNGVSTIENGKHTGARAGKILRKLS